MNKQAIGVLSEETRKSGFNDYELIRYEEI